MTPADVRALSAAVLPRLLAATGFAPLGAQRTITDLLRALHHTPDLWQPHLRWDHAMPLLDVMHAQGWLTVISYCYGRPPEGRGRVEAVGHAGQQHGGYYADGHGPEMVCRLVLMVYYATEGASHEPQS